jgi:hypothetical protein
VPNYSTIPAVNIAYNSLPGNNKALADRVEALIRRGVSPGEMQRHIESFLGPNGCGGPACSSPDRARAVEKAIGIMENLLVAAEQVARERREHPEKYERGL